LTWGVYILQSVPTGHLYTGIAIDPDRRLKAHNAGKGAKRTRAGTPWVLVYWEPCVSKSEALKREYAIKQLSRQAKLDLIRCHQGPLPGQTRPVPSRCPV
jgi:putative endonuclease